MRQTHSHRPAGAGRITTQRPAVAGHVTPMTASVKAVAGGTLTCCKYLAPFVLTTLLALGAAYVRVLYGPVSLKILAEPIARSIAADLPGYSVTIEDALVRLNDEGQFEFRLRNVRLLDEEGSSVALAPLAAVELSRGALWSGRLSASKVVLIEPRMLLSYSPEGGLSFSFARPSEPDEPASAMTPVGAGSASGAAAPSTSSQSAAGQAKTDGLPQALRQIDLARVLAETSAKVRQGSEAASFLRELGLRDATIVFEQGAHQSVWRIPQADVELRHSKGRSAMVGVVSVASARGPWKLDFRTLTSEAKQQVTLKASVRDIVPRSLASAVPELAALNALDLPASGDISLDLTSTGRLLGGRFSLDLAQGNVRLPWLADLPFAIDSGRLDLRYEPGERLLRVAPSTLVWGQSRLTITGSLASSTGPGGENIAFDLTGTEGSLAAEEFGVAPLPLEQWIAQGSLRPETGTVDLKQFLVKAGGGQVRIAGRVGSGEDGSSTDLTGKLSAMPLATLKVIWPRALAPAPRDWVGKNVSRGRIAGGSFSVQSSARPVPGALRKGDGQPRLALSLDANDLEIRTLPNLPSIEVPAGTIRLEGSALEITIPDASAPLAQGRKLALKSGRFVVGDVMAEPPTAEISFRAQGQAAAVIELIEGEPFKVGRIVESTSDIDGKVDGQLTLSLPLKRKLAADDLRVEGLVKLSDGRARQLLGSYDAQAATILFNVSDKAIDAKGDMLIAGVATKLSWQRIFDAPPEKQPPLRLSATLDNSDRAQLGINVSNNILGEVPVELIITPDADDKRHVHIGADLTRADVVLDNIAWRKPPGRAAFLQFDLVPGGRHKTELQNFKVIGDDIAIEGWMGLDAQNRLRELSFPDFSINLITRMELQGVLRNDNVWEIRGRGQTYDGREFFRSLFSVGELGERPPASRRDQPGLDLKVDIDTVIGFSDVSLRRVVMQLSRRAGKLTQLDARGVLDGNKPLEVTLQQAPKERKLVAVSDDAGQVFRLVDFYPSLQGGRMRLEVNLDGRGPAEKTGTLAVDKFRLLGDPVISEVLQFPDENRAVDAPRTRRVVRQSIDFDWMRVPFSVGYGQFVMGESELRGPLVGATLRGKSDFRARTISLVGTYVPLQGLNSALGAIPGLGQLLAGPKGEGVLGITFAVQGPMSQPQVLVNPLSLVAPGIFREMFQLSDPSRTVTPPPRIDQTRPAPDGRGRSPGASAPQGRTTAGEPGISTGWSSETTPVQSTNK